MKSGVVPMGRHQPGCGTGTGAKTAVYDPRERSRPTACRISDASGQPIPGGVTTSFTGGTALANASGPRDPILRSRSERSRESARIDLHPGPSSTREVLCECSVIFDCATAFRTLGKRQCHPPVGDQRVAQGEVDELGQCRGDRFGNSPGDSKRDQRDSRSASTSSEATVAAGFSK